MYSINELPSAHIATGITVGVGIFGAFVSTAMYSRAVKVSPLGRHVMFLEWWLGVASGVYLFAALVAIALFNDHYFHKVFMTFCILSSTGPGIFRALRSTRELVTGRLFKYDKYKLYDQVKCFNLGSHISEHNF